MLRVDSFYRAKALQRDWLLIVFVDDVTDALHEFDLRVVYARATRMTTLTGSEPSLLSRFRNRKESNLFALWTASWT